MGIPFLLTISFLLHVISLAAIYFLWKQMNGGQTPVNQDTKDMVKWMEAYLEEIRYENDKLQQHAAAYGLSDSSMQVQDKQEISIQTSKQGLMPDESALTDQVKDQTDMSLEAQILQLHSQGKRTEEIAKELGCGKTEAALIIKFHAK